MDMSRLVLGSRTSGVENEMEIFAPINVKPCFLEGHPTAEGFDGHRIRTSHLDQNSA
jgi:hypothetical protein